MQMSARILGQEYGMTAEEMNRALLKHGILEGVPGDYKLTEKAMAYAVEKDFHRGCGGYDYYNRYWTTRTYDESIKNILNITDELKAQIRAELREMRVAKKVARAEAEMAYTQSVAENKMSIQPSAPGWFKNVSAIKKAGSAFNELSTMQKAGVIGVTVVGVAAARYGIYKIVTTVKRKRAEREKDVK